MRAPLSIEIVSDTVCPWCFVGKRKLEQALAGMPDVEAEIRWQPYFLDPTIAREGVDYREYLTRKYGSTDQARSL